MLYIIDNLDGLEPNIAALYKSNSDGKFQLQVEGLPPQEDVSGLRSALQTERESVSKFEYELRDWKKLGKTPNDVRAKIDDLTKSGSDPSEGEKLLEQAQIKHNIEIEKISGERDAALASEHAAIVKSGMTAALAKAQFTETGMEMIPQLHGNRIKMVERNGARVPEIMTSDGSAPMVGSGEGNRATFDDLAKEYSEKYPDLVRTDQKGGAGTAPGIGGSGDQNSMSRSAWDKLPVMEQSRVLSDGVSLVD